MKLKINSVPGYSGAVTIQTDGNDIPLDKFWRNRLKDAKTDNCVEVIPPTTTRKERAK
jgi:hypothetical protein